jgi:hypothetical protein
MGGFIFLKAGCTSNLLMYIRLYLRIWLPIHALILWKVCQCVLLIRIWCMNRVVSGGVTVLQLLRGLSLSLSPLISFILCGIYLSSIRILSCIYDFVNVFRYKNHPFASLIFIFEKQITGYLDISLLLTYRVVWSSIVLYLTCISVFTIFDVDSNSIHIARDDLLHAFTDMNICPIIL